MDNKPIFKFALREDLKDEKQFLPTRAEPCATGYDCRAALHNKISLILSPGDYFKIPLGFRAFCPPGWYYQLHPRSSSFIKKYMHNLIGIIDETFPLETLFVGKYLPPNNEKLIINWGDPIAQIIPLKRIDMESIEISNEEYDFNVKERNSPRTGGFGSTG